MNFAVIGAGAWGTSFAVHLCRLGHPVVIVPRRFEQALELSSKRENTDYLPGIELPQSLQIAHEIAPVLSDVEVILMACPAQALRSTCQQIFLQLPANNQLRLIISLSKGLELGSHLRSTEVIQSVFSEPTVAMLTGPTNAAEVALGQPSAMVLASPSHSAFIERVQAALSGPSLRVYTSDDVAGAEYGGCLKNIYAIAAGCSDGLRLGDNTRAALLTRALAEMIRVGTALGARAETFSGLSGFGDLVATCHGKWSRNREFGLRLGEGTPASDLISNRKTVVEGYKTTKAFHELCASKKIDAPILRETYAIVFENKKPAEAISSLMLRDLRRE